MNYTDILTHVPEPYFTLARVAAEIADNVEVAVEVHPVGAIFVGDGTGRQGRIDWLTDTDTWLLTIVDTGVTSTHMDGVRSAERYLEAMRS